MSFHCQRVLNYELQVEGRQMIQMHKGADIIGLVEKNGFPYLLAVEDEEQKLEARVFRCVTTGESFNPEILWYLGTVRLGGKGQEPWFTAHYFEVETALPQHNPDPISERFADDRKDLKREFIEATSVADEGDDGMQTERDVPTTR